MKIEPEDLETEKAWIVGVKFKHEQKFHVQIVQSLSLKQKLWHTYINDINSDYYFYEIDLPLFFNEDKTPF